MSSELRMKSVFIQLNFDPHQFPRFIHLSFSPSLINPPSSCMRNVCKQNITLENWYECVCVCLLYNAIKMEDDDGCMKKKLFESRNKKKKYECENCVC